MNPILILFIIILMPVLTFLIADKREKRAAEKTLRATELDALNVYKYFLSHILQVEEELQNILAATDPYKFKNKICFTPLDIIVLEKEIRDNFEQLTNMVLQKSISINEFHSQLDLLRKRIHILSFPLAA